MNRVVVLDAGPLGTVTNPNLSPQSQASNDWLQHLLHKGARVIVPEIADYEVRRELLRAGKSAGLRRLDLLTNITEYLPITTTTMRLAAQLWAYARQTGQATVDKHALDGDVILAAQVRALGLDNVIVATTNVKHLSRFVTAAHWSEID